MSQNFNFPGGLMGMNKSYVGGYTTANTILGGNNLNTSGAVLNH